MMASKDTNSKDVKEVKEVKQVKPVDLKALIEQIAPTYPALKGDPTASFKDDEEYLTTLEILYYFMFFAENSNNALASHVLRGTEDSEDYVKESQELLAHQALVDYLNQLIKSRLAVMTAKKEPLPRVLRYAAKVPLTEAETVLLSRSIVGQISFKHVDSYAMQKMGASAGMDIKEVLEFVGDHRKHIKQGLYPDMSRSYDPLRNTLMLSQEALKFFVGAKLSTDEFLKVDKTIIAEVLEEEDPTLTQTQREKAKSRPAQDFSFGMPRGNNIYGGGFNTHNFGMASAVVDDESDAIESGFSDKEMEVEGQPEGAAEGEGEGDGEGEEAPKPEEEVDIISLLQQVKDQEKAQKDTKETTEEDSSDADVIKPYRTDLEYLDDHFQHISTKMNIKRNKRHRNEMDLHTETTLRQLEGKARLLAHKIERRMQKTRESGEWLPRLERLVAARKMDDNERNIILILVGYVICSDESFGYDRGSVSGIMKVLCSNLEDEINFRKYFYKNAILVKEGFIKMSYSGLQGDLSNFPVEIDRRMLDFIVGLDTEFSEIVEGSQLYYPKNKLEDVVLPEHQKKQILDTVSNFANFNKWRKKVGLNEVISYGNGVVLLFHGPSGTGKTMMANCVANYLNKKVLLINLPSLGAVNQGEFKFIFREAKINDAILFFDECESIFESRSLGGYEVNVLLTEIELHEGLIIMATNRPYDLDEAMYRRISQSIEFKKPDHLLREEIWKNHLPPKVKLADDIDWKALSLKYELTGGFIKNAILSALNLAVARNHDNPILMQDDLLQGAKLQLKGRLQMNSFEHRVVPKRGLDDCILEPELIQNLYEIVNSSKARSVLFGQWGFGDHSEYNEGTTALFHGPSGTGKTMAANAIGYELGKPLKVVNCTELVAKTVSEATTTVEAIFVEAISTDAIVVFDEADVLFKKQPTESPTTAILLRHMENFDGIVILTASALASVDTAISRRLKYTLSFPIPSPTLRAKLWRSHIPTETPTSSDIDFVALAKKFEFSGGNIKKAVFRAACKAALRPKATAIITLEDLTTAAVEEAKKMGLDFVHI